MAPPDPTELRTVAFDGKDLVLFSAGFVLVVAGLSAWDALWGYPSQWVATTVIIFAVAAPLALRRAVFGWPALPPPKEGFGWSLVSMIGLLVGLGGMGAAAVGVYPLWNGRPLHLGLIAGGLGAVVIASALTALRYPKSDLPSARAVRRQKE